ncbi:MAG: hypothetical protein N3H31_07155 [Candidatus Nezhaarchaeota archaeon]|nr:hypothetical protein [Candidatus Nezhaarchaeota archaeon]
MDAKTSLELRAPPQVGALLLNVARSLGAMLSLNRAVIDSLKKIAKLADGRVVRARAECAIYELSKLETLITAALSELGFGNLKIKGEDEAALLGEVYTNLVIRLNLVLDRLARRVTKKALIDLTNVAESLLKLQAAYLVAFARVVKDYSRKATAYLLLKECSDELLSLAFKMKLMRRVVRLMRTPS